MFARKREGATLGLIPFLVLVIALIGIAFYYIAQFFGGNQQLLSGTDSCAVKIVSWKNDRGHPAHAASRSSGRGAREYSP